jgi:hypothetical protein
MPVIISASRRTDLVASNPGWLSQAVQTGKATVLGPSGHTYTVDISPSRVHTCVLWSKDFGNLIRNRDGLRDALARYPQVYLHFTITGLGGGPWERGVPDPASAVGQLDDLIRLAGSPERISVRFDPILFWNEERQRRSNLPYFSDSLAPELSSRGIRRVRLSFAQWYRKSRRRARRHGLDYVDPEPEEKLEKARELAEAARSHGLELYSCSQDFLTAVSGIEASACIDGGLLSDLHPDNLPVSIKKDKTQRRECRCSESIDIGSYTQHCPRSCVYCYANPQE